MTRIGVVGLGKMGLSHLAILNAHPEAQVAAVCDSNSYVLTTLHKYTGLRVTSDYERLLTEVELDAVVIATPPRLHSEMVRAALERGLHVFCEKPLCLNVADSVELAALADERGLVNQVGYHLRFVASHREAQRLIRAGLLGRIHHVRAEAFGGVVLRAAGSSWRAQRSEGGGCLHDYATHVIDLLTYLIGPPERVGGSVLNRIFSDDVEDEVYATLYFPGGTTGQLAVNWSDDSYRKLTTRVTIWGTNGRLSVDRQELQLFLRDRPSDAASLNKGWNIVYSAGLADGVWYYVRGEEYSAQLDHFVRSVEARRTPTEASFASASQTDRVVGLIKEDAIAPRSAGDHLTYQARPHRRKSFPRLRRFFVGSP
ncbi:MAG TPA: Gfo/Idh/MocA family oxidoreductase [Candidatus Binataceae bacterium]|jgi:predicted dehydrogenase|nr:Gfo/Idh/MocA family oxidoreductase [Candidatus Binataceae bacterium]